MQGRVDSVWCVGVCVDDSGSWCVVDGCGRANDCECTVVSGFGTTTGAISQ